MEQTNENEKQHDGKMIFRTEREKNDAVLAKDVETERTEIPSTEEIIALIPSNAEREYLIKIGWQFSERDRLLLRRYLAPKSDSEHETVYETGCYVSIPFPFRSGDIVTLADNLNCDVGIFASCINDEDWRQRDQRCRTELRDMVDFSDSAASRVEFLCPDGTFYHNHPSVLSLEYAVLPDDDPRKNVLEVASELLRGTNSSIEVLQIFCNDYAKLSTDVAEDIITSRCEKIDSEFEWNDEKRCRLNELNAFLSAQEHKVYDAVRVCASGRDAADGCEVHGTLIFDPNFDECRKRLSLDSDVLSRMIERVEELYTADWDSRYSDITNFDNEENWDKQMLEPKNNIPCGENQMMKVCCSLWQLYRARAFAVQDLLLLPKSAFKIKLETTHSFNAEQEIEGDSV